MAKPIAIAGILGALCVPAVRAQQKDVDVTSYHFTITIPDTGTSITGRAQVRFRAAAGYDDTLRLDLVGMSVGAVTGQDSRTPLPFSYDGKIIRIAAPGLGFHGVVVDYSGSPSDGFLIGTNARGRRSAFADDWPNRARYWLPTIDHPSDKARVAWTVIAPKGWRTVSNAPQCVKGAVPVAACTESVQIPTYTMVIGSGEMSVAAHRPAVVGHDTIPIEVWTYPEDSAFANDVPFARATEIVETMSRLVGPYPYSKLAHVESSTRYGGMENATAIFYAEGPYVKRTMKEGVVRHETAHQWFGDAVTPREWAHLWLSEGFASYFDLVIGAALSGDSVLVNGMRRDKAEWLDANVMNRPVVDIFEKDPNKLLNANVYPKGAWVLHMLREQVGDSAFFRGVRAYYQAYRDTSVVSAQFQEKIEDASGQRLGWFFQQWLYQAGCPKLQVRWTADTTAHTLQLTVLQVQPQAWGRFRLPSLPLALVMPDGSTERRTITVIAQNETVVTLPLAGAAPADLMVDPDGTLLVVSTVLR